MRYWIDLPDPPKSAGVVDAREFWRGRLEILEDLSSRPNIEPLIEALSAARLGICASCAFSSSQMYPYLGLTVFLVSDAGQEYGHRLRGVADLVSFAVGDGAAVFEVSWLPGAVWRVRRFEDLNGRRMSGVAVMHRRGVPVCSECSDWFDVDDRSQGSQFSDYLVREWSGLVP